MNEQNINIDLSIAPSIECEECKNTHFVPVFIIKHLHPLISPTGQDTMVPVQLFKCHKCDHINKRFLEGLTN